MDVGGGQSVGADGRNELDLVEAATAIGVVHVHVHHSNCTETFENSDPVSTLLAAYAISCKLDPKDFNYRADSMCERNLWLGMPPGMSNFVGMPEAEFEARFASYPAPVPVAFATQVTAFAQG